LEKTLDLLWAGTLSLSCFCDQVTTELIDERLRGSNRGQNIDHGELNRLLLRKRHCIL
jgi:hypothetical protein